MPIAMDTARVATPYVIVTSQRTGSTLLVRSLDQSDGVMCAGEIFHSGPNQFHAEFKFPRRVFRNHWLTRFVDVHLSKRRIRRHLARFYAAAGQGASAVGFKLMVSQSRTFPDIIPILQGMGVVFVFLCRDDTRATARSYYRARTSRVFHSGAHAVSAEGASAPVDEAEFKRLLVACESDKRQLMQLHERLGGPLFSYEEMTADWDAFIARFGEAIGIRGLRVPQVLSKLRPGVDAVTLADEDDTQPAP